MRRSTLLALSTTVAALLVTGAASAEGESVAPGGTPSAAGATVGGDPIDADEEADSYAARKKWWVGADFETTRTIIQQDVGGTTKAFNTLGLNTGYQFTANDRVTASGGFMQRFIADATETGLRADDILLSYSHTFRLPWHLGLSANASDSLPISYYSQLESLIALPRLSIGLSRSFLDDTLNVSIRGGGAYYIVKYKEPAQDQLTGSPGTNTQASADIGFSVSYTMPFHRALSVVAGASTAYRWQYNPDHSNDPVLAQQFKNAPVTISGDPFYNQNPPAQQSYGGSVAVLYNLPSLIGIGSTLQVQLSQGDGVLRDGATHLYWLSRRGGQVSAALSANY